jgi:uncharacterized membrane protein YfcA
MPGSLAGAWALSIIPERAALLVLAATVIIVGVRVLFGRTPHGAGITTVGRVSSVPIGVMTGFASALTGTGGPMVLTPVLVWRGIPLLTAILLGQVVQLPIAATATIGNVLTGGADLVAGAVLGLMMVPGALTGRRLAEALPQRVLGYIVGVMLLASGLGFVLKAL